MRNQLRGLAWITGIIVIFVVGGSLRRVIEGPLGDATTLLFSTAIGTAGWWWTAWIMLRGEVRWRPLLPGAALTAMALTGYAMSADLWMPRTMSSNQAQFGFFGVALSLVTWFAGIAFCLVVSTVVAPVLAEDRGWWGRLARGAERRGAPPRRAAVESRARPSAHVPHRARRRNLVAAPGRPHGG